MTESHSGPPGTGSGGQPSEMPTGTGAGASASGTGAGMSASGTSGMSSEGGGAAAGPTSGITTAKRTSAAQASVPQQLGHRQERLAGETELGEPGLGYNPDPITAAARASWAAVLLGAIGMVGLGIALLVWPNASLTVVAILIGAALVVSGLVRLYEGFTARAESGGMRAAYVVIGLLAVVAGLYCLRHHALSLFLVAFVTGVYFIAHGISDLGLALSGNVPNRGMRGVLGVFSLAAGIIMVIWPAITLVLLLTIVAAWLIFYGLMLGALSFGLRRAAKAAAPASVPTQRLAASTR
jgi:uncharacterized membrane protein HdeD (DUF308 family)